MKAVGYIRVSTEEQANEGVGLAAQRAKIAGWCELNGYELTAVHVDAGISGKDMDNRPGLQAALAACTRGTALVVYSLSRLTRRTKHTLEISERLDTAEVDLVSIAERIDTTTAAGKMFFRLMAVLDEFERDLIIERTIAALAVKKTKGERTGGLNYGFQLAADGKTMVPNPVEQQVITQAKGLHAAGLSLRKIAAALDANGFRARNGRIFDSRQILNMVKGYRHASNRPPNTQVPREAERQGHAPH